MQRACDIGKRNKLDPSLRRWVLFFASVFGLAGLIGGFYIGFGFVTGEAAMHSPFMEKLFLNTFIAISCSAAGMIFGAFTGSTIYRIIERYRRAKRA